jgi:hypothetical protein
LRIECDGLEMLDAVVWSRVVVFDVLADVSLILDLCKILRCIDFPYMRFVSGAFCADVRRACGRSWAPKKPRTYVWLNGNVSEPSAKAGGGVVVCEASSKAAGIVVSKASSKAAGVVVCEASAKAGGIVVSKASAKAGGIVVSKASDKAGGIVVSKASAKAPGVVVSKASAKAGGIVVSKASAKAGGGVVVCEASKAAGVVVTKAAAEAGGIAVSKAATKASSIIISEPQTKRAITEQPSGIIRVIRAKAAKRRSRMCVSEEIATRLRRILRRALERLALGGLCRSQDKDDRLDFERAHLGDQVDVAGALDGDEVAAPVLHFDEHQTQLFGEQVADGVEDRVLGPQRLHVRLDFWVLQRQKLDFVGPF